MRLFRCFCKGTTFKYVFLLTALCSWTAWKVFGSYLVLHASYNLHRIPKCSWGSDLVRSTVTTNSAVERLDEALELNDQLTNRNVIHFKNVTTRLTEHESKFVTPPVTTKLLSTKETLLRILEEKSMKFNDQPIKRSITNFTDATRHTERGSKFVTPPITTKLLTTKGTFTDSVKVKIVDKFNDQLTKRSFTHFKTIMRHTKHESKLVTPQITTKQLTTKNTIVTKLKTAQIPIEQRERSIPTTPPTGNGSKRIPGITTATKHTLSTITTRSITSSISKTTRRTKVRSLPSKSVIRCRKATNTKIPNVIHHIWFGNRTFQFYHYISLRSAALIQRPEKVRLYYDVDEPQGPLWRLYKSEVPCLVLVKYKVPTSIFGQRVNVVEHRSDIARMKILLNQGGIYLDTDTVMVNPFDPLMNYSCVLGQEIPGAYGNGIILAEPYSKFLIQWYKSYQTFNDSKWSDHSVFMPYILHHRHPELPLHVEITSFLRPNWADGMAWFEKKNYDISKNYCVHLYARLLQRTTLNYREWNILNLNVTYGALARIALYGTPELINV